jgi:hypothetical protein
MDDFDALAFLDEIIFQIAFASQSKANGATTYRLWCAGRFDLNRIGVA